MLEQKRVSAAVSKACTWLSRVIGAESGFSLEISQQLLNQSTPLQSALPCSNACCTLHNGQIMKSLSQNSSKSQVRLIYFRLGKMSDKQIAAKLKKAKAHYYKLSYYEV